MECCVKQRKKRWKNKVIFVQGYGRRFIMVIPQQLVFSEDGQDNLLQCRASDVMLGNYDRDRDRFEIVRNCPRSISNLWAWCQMLTISVWMVSWNVPENAHEMRLACWMTPAPRRVNAEGAAPNGWTELQENGYNWQRDRVL